MRSDLASGIYNLSGSSFEALEMMMTNLIDDITEFLKRQGETQLSEDIQDMYGSRLPFAGQMESLRAKLAASDIDDDMYEELEDLIDEKQEEMINSHYIDENWLDGLIGKIKEDNDRAIRNIEKDKEKTLEKIRADATLSGKEKTELSRKAELSAEDMKNEIKDRNIKATAELVAFSKAVKINSTPVLGKAEYLRHIIRNSKGKGKEKFNRALDETIAEGLSSKEGLRAVDDRICGEYYNKWGNFNIKTLEDGRIPKGVVNIHKFIEEAEKGEKSLRMQTLSQNVYNRFLPLIKEDIAQGNASILDKTNGEHMVVFTEAMSPRIQALIMAAAFDCGEHQYLTEDEVRREILATSPVLSEAAELRFENIPVKMAWSIVERADKNYLNGKSHGLRFAIKDNGVADDGLVTLICNAGNSKEERDAVYTDAMSSIAQTALLFTGAKKEIEEKKASFIRNRSTKINKAIRHIEDEGQNKKYYVFLAKTRGSEIQSDHYIEFDKDKAIIHDPDGTTKSRAKENETNYKEFLSRLVKTSSGTPVLLTEQEMTDISVKAETIEDTLIPKLRAMGDSDLREGIKEGISRKQEEYRSLSKREQHGSQGERIKNEIKNLTNLSLLIEPGSQDIGKDRIESMLLNEEIKKGYFTGYEKDKAKLLKADGEKEILINSVPELIKNDEISFSNRLKLDTRNRRFSSPVQGEIAEILEAVSEKAEENAKALIEKEADDISRKAGLSPAQTVDMKRILCDHVSFNDKNEIKLSTEEVLPIIHAGSAPGPQQAEAVEMLKKLKTKTEIPVSDRIKSAEDIVKNISVKMRVVQFQPVYTKLDRSGSIERKEMYDQCINKSRNIFEGKEEKTVDEKEIERSREEKIPEI